MVRAEEYPRSATWANIHRLANWHTILLIRLWRDLLDLFVLLAQAMILVVQRIEVFLLFSELMLKLCDALSLLIAHLKC